MSVIKTPFAQNSWQEFHYLLGRITGYLDNDKNIQELISIGWNEQVLLLLKSNFDNAGNVIAGLETGKNAMEYPQATQLIQEMVAKVTAKHKHKVFDKKVEEAIKSDVRSGFADLLINEIVYFIPRFSVDFDPYIGQVMINFNMVDLARCVDRNYPSERKP